MPDRIHVVSYDVKDKIYLLMEKDGKTWVIRGWHSESDAVRYFEDGYRRAFEMGGGYVAGAVIANAQTQPRVHTTTLDELIALLGPKPSLVALTGMAVFDRVLEFPATETVQAFRAKGVRPRFG